jgi:LL-diaminopimelate aminotransferase
MKQAKKLQHLSSSIFTEMADHKRRLLAAGRDIVDLGIGSPDLPPPPHVRQAMVDAVQNPQNYGYSHFQGYPWLREAFAAWFANRFAGVTLDPLHEVLTLIGSQDGLSHLPSALLDPGDVALIPDPSYPVYAAGVHLASGVVEPMPLLPENGFLPDFDLISEDVQKRAKMMILSYPGNPIPAMADEAFYAKAVAFCREHDIVLVHDLAYSELAFDDYKPISILQIPGARDIAVEFHSLSKSFSMAGCRIGFIAGNAEIVGALTMLKSNIDYGVFGAVQHAAAVALRGDQSYLREMAAVYQERRDVLLGGLAEIGWTIDKPPGTMFAWAKLPVEMDSKEFALQLLEQTGIVVIPGNAFGEHGQGYVRIALVQPPDRLREVVQRIQESRILEPRVLKK